MASALGSAQHFTFVWVKLVKGFKAYSHRYTIVIVSHTATSQMSRYQLDLHLGSHFLFEDVCEMPQLIRTTTHELV